MRHAARSVALLGFLGSGNLGNDASLETALQWLAQDAPDVRVECVTICPEIVEARYGLPSSHLSSYRPGPGTGRMAATFGKVAGRVRDAARTWALAGRVDVVLVPGMGVLEDSLAARPMGLPLWMFLAAAACRLRARRFVLLDVGAERAHNPLTRWLFVATVRLADHVSYRDEWSAEAMRASGAPEPNAVVPDLAFAHPAAQTGRPQPGHVVVGVMAYYGPGDDPVTGAPVRRRYVDSMVDALCRLLENGNRVVLVGGDRVDGDVAREIQACLRVRCPAATDAVSVREAETFTDLAEEMSRAEVVVASRFHNVICALRLARPTVSLAYATKSHRLMESMGLADYCQEIASFDVDRLVEQVRSAQADAAGISDRISLVATGYAMRVDELLAEVSAGVLGRQRTARPAEGRPDVERDGLDAGSGADEVARAEAE